MQSTWHCTKTGSLISISVITNCLHDSLIHLNKNPVCTTPDWSWFIQLTWLSDTESTSRLQVHSSQKRVHGKNILVCIFSMHLMHMCVPRFRWDLDLKDFISYNTYCGSLKITKIVRNLLGHTDSFPIKNWCPSDGKSSMHSLSFPECQPSWSDR